MTVSTRSAPSRQLHFPARPCLSMPSTKSDLRERRRRRVNQSTLTQMPSFTSSFQGKSHDGDEVSEAEGEWEAPRPKKKRKMMSVGVQDGGKQKTKKRTQDEEDEALGVRQSTLTQIGWPWPVDDSEEEDEEDEEGVEGEMIRGGEGVVPDSEGSNDGEDDEDDDHAVEFGQKMQDQENVIMNEASPSKIRHHEKRFSPPLDDRLLLTPSPTRPPSTASPARIIGRDSPVLGDSPLRRPPITTHQPPITPKKIFPRFIPSSQSPATTPGSMHSISPQKRMPLQELHKNIWSQRDEQRDQSPTPQRKKIIPDSEATEDDEKENWVFDVEPEEDVHYPYENKSSTKTSSTTMRSQASPAKSLKDLEDDTLSMPPPPSRPRFSDPSSSAPMKFLSQPDPEEQSASSPEQAPPSSWVSQPDRRDFAPQHSHTTTTHASPDNFIRPSQASTVDLTQPSPRVSPRHKTLPSLSLSTAHAHPETWKAPFDIFVPEIPPSPPPVFESQFPYSMFSLEGSDEGGLYERYGESGDSQERG